MRQLGISAVVGQQEDYRRFYGIDTEWKARPQMVEGHTVEEDGLTWTLKLRDGLHFHDKEPVLARDV
ncbi:MAG TPA: ABC transporter substrate-binding protein, partial [Stellaceae bacterium]|nr:ABC transporter substrate-binding protein [Stellaceae bacterium]